VIESATFVRGPDMRLTFEESAARFGHIDGRVEAVRLTYPDAVEIDVRFYPWWEHPQYRAAIARGARWGFRRTEAVSRTATILAAELETVHFSGMSAIDVGFSEDHPILWASDDDRRSILVNSDVNREQLAQALGVRQRAEGRRDTVGHVLGYLAFDGQASLRAPCSVGHLPRQLYSLVAAALEDIGVEVLREELRWRSRERRLLVQIGDSYVIASSILFNVPEFEHPPEVYAGE
jgi:hypothetical protein